MGPRAESSPFARAVRLVLPVENHAHGLPAQAGPRIEILRIPDFNVILTIRKHGGRRRRGKTPLGGLVQFGQITLQAGHRGEPERKGNGSGVPGNLLMRPKSEHYAQLGNRGARSHTSWMYRLERSSPQLKSVRTVLVSTRARETISRLWTGKRSRRQVAGGCWRSYHQT